MSDELQFEDLARKSGANIERVQNLLNQGANPAQIQELLQFAIDNGVAWEPSLISGMTERGWPQVYSEEMQTLKRQTLAKQLGANQPELGYMNRAEVMDFLEFLRDENLTWDPKEVPFGGNLDDLKRRVRLHAAGDKQSVLGYTEDYLGGTEIGSNANREANAEIRREREAQAAKNATAPEEEKPERTAAGVPPTPIVNPGGQATAPQQPKPPGSTSAPEPKAEAPSAAAQTPTPPPPTPPAPVPAPGSAPGSSQAQVVGLEKGNLPPSSTRTR